MLLYIYFICNFDQITRLPIGHSYFISKYTVRFRLLELLYSFLFSFYFSPLLFTFHFFLPLSLVSVRESVSHFIRIKFSDTNYYYLYIIYILYISYIYILMFYKDFKIFFKRYYSLN